MLQCWKKVEKRLQMSDSTPPKHPESFKNNGMQGKTCWKRWENTLWNFGNEEKLKNKCFKAKVEGFLHKP